MEDAIKAITSDSFISVFVLTIGLILLGYFFTKFKIFKDGASQTLKIVELYIALPCLAFVGFLSDFDFEAIGVFIFSLIAYIILFLISRLVFMKTKKENKGAFRVIFSIGLVTMYGQPIAKGLFGNEILASTNMITIAFRLFLYIYSYYLISGASFDKTHFKSSLKSIFLNPIMIAMLLGILIWSTQSIFFKVNVDNAEYSVLRIDKTVPWLYSILKIISELTIPVGMLLVGCNLGKVNLKEAFTSKESYFLSICRVFIAPLIVLGLCFLWNLIFKEGNSFNLSANTVSAIILCFGSPMSVVVSTYCVNFKKCEIVSSNCVLLTTLFTIISIPLFLLLTQLIF